ncbi:MAG: glycosyltransferase, partial [Candidatus Electryonea clarkiae]|nr:glycosyltransferase [Candidatus Electryonea clarkiae]
GDVKIVPLRPRTGLKRRILSSLDAFRKALTIKADIYHFHDPDLLPWMLILQLMGKNVVYDIHDNYIVRFYEWNLPHLLRDRFAAIYRGLENFCISRFQGIVTTTESMGELFEKSAHNRVVIHNVVYVERMQDIDVSVPRHTHPDLVISGTNADSRNSRKIVKALKIINEQFPEVKLRFIGRYDPESYEQILSDLAEKIGVRDNLILEGMVPWEENFTRMSRSHIGCVFYKDNLNNRVTTPNRLYEYMFCGLPILVDDFPELRKIVTETNCGIIVDSSSPRSIADGALQLLEDPERAMIMGCNGREAILNKYNFKSELCGMIRMYHKIVQEHRESNHY